MEFRTIVAVTKLPGLYQLISTKNDGAFVKSLSDQSVKFISARVHHVTPLESIEIYTDDENVKLYEVLENVKKQEESLSQYLTKVGKLTNEEAKSFFAAVLPNYDTERVYLNDINKIAKWFGLLKANDALNFEYLAAPAPQGEVAEEVAEEVAIEEKPKKKVTKTAVKKASSDEEPVAEKEKKTTKKKKDATAE